MLDFEILVGRDFVLTFAFINHLIWLLEVCCKMNTISTPFPWLSSTLDY